MFYIRENDENIIFKCKSQEFNHDDLESVQYLVQCQPQKSIVVNFSGVSKIKNKTLNLLKKIAQQNKISLCSLDADIFAVINLLHYDNSFSIYPDEKSSINKKSELKNRRFKIV